MLGDKSIPVPVWFENFDLNTISTPINVRVLARLLRRSGFDDDKSEEIIEEFTHGFNIGYQGPMLRQDSAKNIPFTIGNSHILLDKIMKEVSLGRVAGPFEEVPFHNYMQSPIGLVPKAGNKTRLIFHLSYKFPSGLGLLNSNTPKDLCLVQYQDLDEAVRASL